MSGKSGLTLFSLLNKSRVRVDFNLSKQIGKTIEIIDFVNVVKLFERVR